MIQSIKNICAERGVDLNDTVYGNSSPKMLDFKIISGDFYELKDRDCGKKILCYKNCLEILDFSMIKEQLPQLEKVRFSKRDSFPYFSAGLCDMKRIIDRGEKVAVEGGPCLFGTNEVMIEVIRKDGRRDCFDYNTGKAYLENEQDGKDMDFAAYINAYAKEIHTIHFDNKKIGITPQEWAFMKYPFEIAEAIEAPLVIPIPDMSYLKYLSAVLKNTDEIVRRNAIEEFCHVEYEITDLYLNMIEQMRTLYQSVRCEVVHARDKQLCEKYYEARSPYMERNKVIRNLTAIPEKLESVKDYVSMPALPFYLFGINNVIEVDSMDETDSFRKCRKSHKGALNLSCILFPELLSTDMVHTIFDAPWDRKEYGRYEMVRES